MRSGIELSIAATSRGRAKIAAEIALSLYDHMLEAGLSQISLALGTGDSQLGGLSAPAVVGRKKYDLGFSNPAGLARMALLGRGVYRQKIPLRAIGVFPSWDRVVFAVRAETGIRSLEEIVEKKYPLRVSTRKEGKFQTTLFAIREVLKAHGFSFADIERWGGKILRVNNPGSSERADHIQKGEADAVFDEGIKSWGARALASGMRFLPLSGEVLRGLEKMGFQGAPVTSLHYPELQEEITTLDFSGWVLLCHREMSRDLAYKIAMAIDLRHERIPVDHLAGAAMTMKEFCQGGVGGPLTIPLHPGAKRYYEEKGYL